MEERFIFSVFTKPWQKMPGEKLGELVSKLGFDAIEYPVRPGYQVEPENVREELPKLAKELTNASPCTAFMGG